MLTNLNTSFMQQFSSHVLLVLCVTLINGLLFFTIVSLIVRRMKRMAANHKHIIWLFVLFCFFTIPSLSVLLPTPELHSAGQIVVEVLTGEQIKPPAAETPPPETVPAVEEKSYTLSQKNAALAETSVLICTMNWRTVIMLVWLAGVLISLLRILVGRIGLHCLIQKAVPLASRRFSSLVRDLSKDLCVRQSVHVWQSGQCITPFTCFLFKPVILLPASTDKWSEERLRVVLLHELAHIRRRDHISRCIARIVCALLWFVPPVWIVYRNMQIEEEKACDAAVVGKGVRVSDYAGHLVDIACSTRGRVLSLMLQHFFGRRSMLEPRIRNILRMRGSGEQVRVGVLLRILVICFIVLLSLHMVNPLSARDYRGRLKKEVPVELLYGRWVNTQSLDIHDCESWMFIGNKIVGKLVVDPEGTYHVYSNPTIPEYSYMGENGSYTVKESYVDSKGYCYYKVFTEAPYGPYAFYHLWRIGPSGSTMELTWHDAEFPDEIDPHGFAYAQLHR
jgi:beta-lactamase regulating signal transducer with metallopeptidase domain